MGKIADAWRAFLRTNGYLLTGRLRFPRQRMGKHVVTPDGREFTVFREGKVEPNPRQPERAGATFVVRFHTKMAPDLNKPFSLLPMPFCMGYTGFRTKLWTMDDKSGDFQGIYEWDSAEDAENYARSAALTFMTGRSVPGSVWYRIFLGCREETIGWHGQAETAR